MADKNVVININTAIDQGGLDKGIKDVEKKVDDLNKGDDTSIKIKLAMEKLSESKSLKDYKTSLRELKGLALEVGDTNKQQFQEITTAIGQTNDKISDMNSVIKSTSGEPIENLGRSFRGVGDNLKALDFKTAKSQFDVMTDSAKKLTGQLFGGFNVMKNYKTAMMEGKTSTESLSIATKGLGKAVAATGIGLLVIAVAALIANFDKLKTSGGIIGSMFTAIGDTIEWITQKLKDLSDYFGLTDFEGQKKAENTVKNSQIEQDAITERYDTEIKLAKAAGKDTTQLEKDKLKAVMSSIQTQIDAYENRSTTLSDDQKKELEDWKKQLKGFNTDLAVIDAEAQKKKDDDKEKAKEKQKIADDKEKERIKHHKEEIRKIEEKYLLSNRDKLAAGYDDDLKKFNLKNESEKKMYDDLLNAKAMALDKYDKDRQAERDKAGEDALKELEDELDKEQELRDAAASREKDASIAAKQIKLEALQFQETLKGSNKLVLLQQQYDLEGQILDDQLKKELENKKLTEAEKKNIQDKYRLDKEKLEEEYRLKQETAEEEHINKQFEKAAKYTQAIGSLANDIFTIRSAFLKKGSEEEKKNAKIQFNIAKGISIATATVTGIQSVMEAYKNGMKNPIPLLGPATATVYAVAAGISSAANIAKIASTKFDEGGGGGGVTGDTGNIPTPPNDIPTRLPSNTMPAGSTIGLGETKTLKPRDGVLQYQQVYVTETDIRKTMNRVDVIENRSKIR